MLTNRLLVMLTFAKLVDSCYSPSTTLSSSISMFNINDITSFISSIILSFEDILSLH